MRMTGWCGKILIIDLNTLSTTILSPDIKIYKKFIGGKGLAGYYLRDYITLDWDNPNMPILFFTGPLINTISPTSGRISITSRSPLTGTIGDTSVGGTFGTQLKRAGWDGIIITGKSKTICGIEINNQKIKFNNASHLTGLKINETHSIICNKGATAIIGPAAENGVMFSNIAIDNHFFAGRNGLGLLFSSKNIKYITVKGNSKTEVYDNKALKKAREDILRLVSASPILMGELGISKFGTAAIYDLMNTRRMMPTDNFKKTYFPGASKINAFAFKKEYDPIMNGCHGCHIRCKKMTKNGIALPEFETLSHFSALIGNKNIKTTTELNKICNEMGMDTITAGATLSCYIEITGNKLPSKKIVTLLNEIALAKGIGKELAQGSYRYAQKKGNPEASITVKKQELPAYDPRGAYGMALAYATSTRGGCHLRAYPISHEILRKPVASDRFTFSGKSRIIKIAEDLNAVIDSLTACKFVFFAASLEEYSKVYTAVTGVSSSAQDLLKIGERIYYQEKIMNSLNNFTSKDDDLPARFFNKPGTSGNNINIKPINREEFLKARSNYYKIRGLDQDGQPIKKKAKELDLEWKN
jgi:aldehyde:ferredoxin oxidoreductase